MSDLNHIAGGRAHTPVDATAGPITKTLPTTGVLAGDEVSAEKYDSSANAVTITGSIRGVAAQTITLSLSKETVSFRADSSGSWWPIAGHKTLTSLDGRYPRTDGAQSLTYAQQLQLQANSGVQYVRAPGPSGDTTGVTDLANLTTWINALSYGSGVVRPTGTYIAGTIGTGPYYINGTLPTLRPGMSIRSLSPSGTIIFCVGGTAGVAFVRNYDPSFSLSGYDLTSQGGEVIGLVLDGSRAAGGTIGLQRGDIQNSRLDITVQKFGGVVVTGTGGASVAVTVNGRSDTATMTTGAVAIADPSITIADIGTVVTIPTLNVPLATPMVAGAVIKGVSFTPFYGSAPAAANATANGSQTVQVGWVRNDTITLTSGSNRLPTANAIAADLGMPVYNANLPLGSVVIGVDPGVALYIGTPSIGVYYKNTIGWFEGNTDRIQAFNCHEIVVFDGSAGDAIKASFDYNDMRIWLNADHGQHGVVLRNGVAAIGGTWSVYKGHHARGPANPGVGLLQAGSSFFRGTMHWHQELGGLTGAQGPVSHFIQESTSTFGGDGAMVFLNQSTPSVIWQVSKLATASMNAGGTNIAFSGDFGNWLNTVTTAGFGMTARKTSGLQTESAGFANVAASTITLNWQGGNYFKFGALTAGTAYTVALSGTPAASIGTQAYKLTLIATQVASGSVATISSWFSGITWVGTASPTTPAQLTTTLGGQTVFEMLTTDGGNTWTARASS